MGIAPCVITSARGLPPPVLWQGRKILRHGPIIFLLPPLGFGERVRTSTLGVVFISTTLDCDDAITKKLSRTSLRHTPPWPSRPRQAKKLAEKG